MNKNPVFITIGMMLGGLKNLFLKFLLYVSDNEFYDLKMNNKLFNLSL